MTHTPQPDTPPTFAHALHLRQGLPEDLRGYITRHPRSSWPQHPAIQGLAGRWLGIHGSLRHHAQVLAGTTEQFRQRQLSPQDFAQAFVPQCNRFLGGLHAHHNHESEVYFPIFAAADARIRHGFDLLNADHDAIDAQVQAMAKAANTLLRATQQPRDAQLYALDTYSDQQQALMRLLNRHLEDEEDIVVPLVLDRGEHALMTAQAA